jgi:hypothetical protein
MPPSSSLSRAFLLLLPSLLWSRQRQRGFLLALAFFFSFSGLAWAQTKLGEECSATVACRTGLVCVFLQSSSTKGVCVPPCNAGKCAGGETCEPVTGQISACLCRDDQGCPSPKTCEKAQCVGTLPAGASCSPQQGCAFGLLCTTGPGKTQPTCFPTCYGGTCSGGEPCKDIGGYKVCV